MTLPKIITSNEKRALYKTRNHPLATVKRKIEQFFSFPCFDHLTHQTNIKSNFDDLLVPLTHPARSVKDTFYLNEQYSKSYPFLLKTCYQKLDKLNVFYKYYICNKLLSHEHIQLMQTHMTAHLPSLLKQGCTNAIYTGPVFRRDQIDKSHFPIFHQTDGFFIKPEVFDVERNLQNSLEELIKHLFQSTSIQMEWDHNTTFPFTHPSMELYIKRNKEDKSWIEVLGCGRIKKEVTCNALYQKEIYQIIENEINKFDHMLISSFAQLSFNEKHKEHHGNEVHLDTAIINKLCNEQMNQQIEKKITKFLESIHIQGWAFGIGIDRIAMLLYEIPDIRLLWSTDNRFINQFKENAITKFQPFSNFPPIEKDISFFLHEKFTEEIFFEICRDIANENIEQVKKIDEYFNSKTNQTSVCYRITYRSHHKNLTHQFVNDIQNHIVQELVRICSVQIR